MKDGRYTIETYLNEIDRKALDVCACVISDYKNGKVSKATFAYAVGTLYNAVSGLTREATEPLNKLVTHADFKTTDDVDLTFWHKLGIMRLTFSRKGIVTYRIHSFEEGVVVSESVFSYENEENGIRKAKEKFVELAKKIVQGGAQKI